MEKTKQFDTVTQCNLLSPIMGDKVQNSIVTIRKQNVISDADVGADTNLMAEAIKTLLRREG